MRDLYWLLFSEAPLSDEYDLSPFSLFPQQILDDWQIDSVNYFKQLDKHPKDIEQFVDRKKNKRLGFYAESLLSYFFQTFSEVELLLQNFQINKEKITVGEIDFIILYKNTVIHIECSTKYFLLKDINKAKEASQWVGPRLKDNLEKKLKKIINHQIPLGLEMEIQDKINRKVDQSYLLIKGVFFAEEVIQPGKINRKQTNKFLRFSELQNFNSYSIEVLSRPNWLSAFASSEINHTRPNLEFDSHLENPIMCLFNDGEVRFIVPDNWGSQ